MFPVRIIIGREGIEMTDGADHLFFSYDRQGRDATR